MALLETIGLLVKALRPKQWPKNLIAFAPVLFAEKVHDLDAMCAASVCVITLCLASGGVYILNDVIDVEQDRAHPEKCRRPIASGKLSAYLALATAAFVLVAAIVVSYSVRPTLALIIVGYLTLNVLYGAWLKRLPLIDVFCIASGFVLRAIAGAVAVNVPPSPWFLLVTSLGALFLALEKRRKELQSLGDDAAGHRSSLRGYSPELLDRLEAVVVPSLVTSYAFYSFLSIHGQWMMLTVPFVLYGVMRYQYLSVRKGITATPEEVLWRDRPTQIAIVLFLLVAAGVVYQLIPAWIASLVHATDTLHTRPPL